MTEHDAAAFSVLVRAEIKRPHSIEESAELGGVRCGATLSLRINGGVVVFENEGPVTFLVSEPNADRSEIAIPRAEVVRLLAIAS